MNMEKFIDRLCTVEEDLRFVVGDFEKYVTPVVEKSKALYLCVTATESNTTDFYIQIIRAPK